MADAAKDEKPAVQQISLKVKGQDGQEVFFKIKKTAKLVKMMRAYAERQAIAPEAIRFVFDGHRLNENQTPEELDMEDNDEIDAFLEQTGGATL
eukprot:CAMPEP_0119164128 /NCGR_PEP_ID=MMETSP1315-20130426/4057_1 /TAXON_ID=676789 /ORGANISM="Prasinoderma singularis, Strain RCC927" /LENGTH=93 /DNA_ID=CAMNT_0007157245 /DNA_START=73 /DNA_END=354 /DNA_ORIENTATION=+